jgi:hypothetical protein
MKINKRNLLTDILAGLFIILFVYSALSKLQDFEKFSVELGKSPILNAFSGPVSIFIPMIEIVISAMLVIKRFQYIALYLSFCLMVVFSTYIVLILKFSAYIPCSCGGILQNMTWTQHLIFNIGFVFLGLIAVLIYPNRMKNLLQ